MTQTLLSIAGILGVVVWFCHYMFLGGDSRTTPVGVAILLLGAWIIVALFALAGVISWGVS